MEAFSLPSWKASHGNTQKAVSPKPMQARHAPEYIINAHADNKQG